MVEDNNPVPWSLNLTLTSLVIFAEKFQRKREGGEREREQAFKNYSFKLEAKWIFFINKRKVTKEILIVNFEL